MRLRETIRSNQGQILTVLDIGTKKVSCLIARVDTVKSSDGKSGMTNEIHVIGFGHQASSGIRSGFVRDLAAAEHSVRAAVSQAEDMAGMEVKNVLLSVACGGISSLNFTASVNIAGNAVRKQELDRAIQVGEEYAERDGRQVLHLFPISYLLDGQAGVRDPLGMVGDKLSVDLHAVTADTQPLRNLCLVVERCHLTIQGLVAAPYASGLAAVAEDEARLGVTCIDIGGWTTNLSVFVEGHFVYADTIAMGGEQVTNDIADALSTSLPEAERIKTFYGGLLSASSDSHELIAYQKVGEDFSTNNRITRAQLVDLIRPRMEEILITITERLEKSGMGELAGHRVVLTGGGSQMPGVAQFSASLLGKAVRIGRPCRVEGLPDIAHNPSFSASVGLLMYPMQPHAFMWAVRQSPVVKTGTGYFSRIGEWIRESF